LLLNRGFLSPLFDWRAIDLVMQGGVVGEHPGLALGGVLLVEHAVLRGDAADPTVHNLQGVLRFSNTSSGAPISLGLLSVFSICCALLLLLFVPL
jgi:hypothetical protein